MSDEESKEDPEIVRITTSASVSFEGGPMTTSHHSNTSHYDDDNDDDDSVGAVGDQDHDYLDMSMREPPTHTPAATEAATAPEGSAAVVMPASLMTTIPDNDDDDSAGAAGDPEEDMDETMREPPTEGGSSVEIDLSIQDQDAKTRAQMEAIGEEIRVNQKLTSELRPIASLAADFAAAEGESQPFHAGFQQGCAYLAQHYKHYRAVRGDGNCYYRAFLFALVEHLCHTAGDTSELDRIKDYVGKKSIEDVVKCGYDKFTIEMFHEEMVELLQAVTRETKSVSFRPGDNKPAATASTTTTSGMSTALFNRLNEENGTSDYCVWYLRVVTASYLKADPQRFVHFLDDPSCPDVATYCAKEIDPMGKECSMVGVLALAEAFGIGVDIEYMDGRPLEAGGGLARHSFGGDGGTKDALRLTLLYRPGHYDILYK